MVDLNSKLPYYEFFGERSDLGERLGKKFKEHCHNAFSRSSFVQKLITLDQENPDILENFSFLKKSFYLFFTFFNSKWDDPYAFTVLADIDLSL